MQFVSWNNELGCATLLFARCFSNIQIERTDKKGNKSWLSVPCVNGKRSRILKALENPDRKGIYSVPMIVYQRTGYSRNTDRLNSLHNEVKYEITSSNRNYQLLTPVPIDVEYEVSIIAKYQVDIDKIASNFMVFFNSDIFVAQNHPKYDGIKLNNQIIMSDNVSEDHPDELDGRSDDLITTTFSFTFKTFLFGGTTQAQRRRRQAVSRGTTAVLSSAVREFWDTEQAAAYFGENPGRPLSGVVDFEAQVPTVTYDDGTSAVLSGGSEPEGEYYEDGIPVVNKLDFGFYAVPHAADFHAYVSAVDAKVHDHTPICSYISSESYVAGYTDVIDDEGNAHTVSAALSGVGNAYEKVDENCSLAPYVDRIRWTIDATSDRLFPDNVKPDGCWG